MTIDWIGIQEKWQKAWKKAELGKATTQTTKPKFFMIFAYPGISGFLHVGHMRGFSYTDAICRYERLQGKEVLFPVGTHASGNHAIAFANKIKNNDEKWISYLKNNGCPDQTIKEMVEPDKIIDYFNNVYVNDYWKKFGFLCDWERFTSTTFKDYEKFIQWQFRKLHEKNLLVQKPYFATACITHGPVAVDPSETDISKGGNAEKQEYTLLKFKLKDDFLVAATLRPETVFGQTNLWIKPNGKYVRVEVESESWIMSQEAAQKLKYQKDDVVLKEDISPLELIGQKVLAPGIEREIIILPASFVNPAVGSGIVTSVPSDAPFDYVALTTLQNNEELIREFNLNKEEIKEIELIPIITSKGYGKFPAKEIVEKMKIASLNDPKLEDATKEIYKAGFHTGVIAENCGKYVGKKAQEAKELMKAEFIAQGKADIFHDLSEEVLCRCGEKVVIKRIDDQWFIHYADSNLTAMSKAHANTMTIFPQEYHDNFPKVLDWFQDRACARLGNWQGSKFPFDEKWTIEPISDSTLYPSYYIVSKFVNNGTLSTKDLTEEFFDYVFLGKGEGKKAWEQVREEFNYFYPLDMNLGGKEHKTVHFPVFLMNHVAILPPEKWPKGIFVNWWVTGKGSKISKSKGGAEPIPDAIEKYGVDAMRLYYAHIGSPHVDVVWTEDVVLNYKNGLERINSIIDELRGKDGEEKKIDEWLISRINEHLQTVKESMQGYNLRDLASVTYFTLYDDLRWYSRRGGEHKKTINTVLDIWFRMMNPITPHLSEELNSAGSSAKSKELVSASKWPGVNQEMISRTASAGEELIRNTLEGMRNVMKLAKLQTPKKFTIFISESWKYPLFERLQQEIQVTRNIGEILRTILQDEELKMRGGEVSKVVQTILKDVSKLPAFIISQEDEISVLKDAKKFLEQEFECIVEIINEGDHAKAKSAIPGKVGILIE